MGQGDDLSDALATPLLSLGVDPAFVQCYDCEIVRPNMPRLVAMSDGRPQLPPVITVRMVQWREESDKIDIRTEGWVI